MIYIGCGDDEGYMQEGNSLVGVDGINNGWRLMTLSEGRGYEEDREGVMGLMQAKMRRD